MKAMETLGYYTSVLAALGMENQEDMDISDEDADDEGPETRRNRKRMQQRFETASEAITAHKPVMVEDWPTPRDWTIYFWNINGLKHVLKTGVLKRFLETFLPTVICLSEIKQRKDKLAKLSKRIITLLSEFGYTSYLFNTCDNPDTGYSGTAILSQVKPERFVEGWGHDTKAKDTEGRVITAVFTYHIIVNTYAPSSGLVLAKTNFEAKRRDHERNMAQHIRWLKLTYPERPIQLMGDLNICPTIHDVFDGETNEERRMWPGFKDWEQQLYREFLRDTDLVNAYDELHGVDARTMDHYTFWQTSWLRRQGKGWRLDHTLVTPDMLDAKRGEQSNRPYITQVSNLTAVPGSDHCPCGYILYNADPSVPRKARVNMVMDDDSWLQEPLSSQILEAGSSKSSQQEHTDQHTRKVAEKEQKAPRNPLLHTEVEHILKDLEGRFQELSLEGIEDDDEDLLEDMEHGQRLHTLMEFLDKEGPIDADDLAYLDDAGDRRCRPEPDMRARMASVVSASVPMIEISINKTDVRILCDSGASYSVMSTKTLRRISGENWERTVRRTGCLPRFELADGSFTRATGRVRLSLKIHPNTRGLQQSFYVISTEKEQAILGVDFFIRTGAVLNFAKKTLRFERLHGVRQRRFEIEQQARTLRGAMSPIYLLRKVQLEPGEEIATECFLADSDSLSGIRATGEVVEAGQGTKLRHMTIPCVTRFRKKSNTATVRIANVDTTASTLLPGTIVGYFTPKCVVCIHEQMSGTKVPQPSDYAPEDEVVQMLKRFDFSTFREAATKGTRAAANLGNIRRPERVVSTANNSDMSTVTQEGTARTFLQSRICTHPNRTIAAVCTACGYKIQGTPAPRTGQVQVLDNSETAAVGTTIQDGRKTTAAKCADDSETAAVKTTIQDGRKTTVARCREENEKTEEKKEQPTIQPMDLTGEDQEEEPKRGDIQPMDLTGDDQEEEQDTEGLRIATAHFDDYLQNNPHFTDGIPTKLWPEIEACRKRYSKERCEKLIELLRRFPEIFHHKGDRLSTVKGLQARIHIPKGTPPVAVRQRRLNPQQRNIIIEYVKKLRDQDIIEPVANSGGWNNALILVRKADNTWRTCLDLRATNALTQPIVSSLPVIQDCLDAMSGSKIFTIADCAQCFFQMELHPDDRNFTSFYAPVGASQWRFKRAVMGAVNSQQSWINFANGMLGELNWRSTVAYSDDLATFSEDFETHLKHLEELFIKLKEHRCVISPEKLQLARDKVCYVGLIISEHGIATDPSSTEAIRELPLPETLKELRRWLGLTGWWRKFIRNYARITHPLRPLLKKGQFTAKFSEEQKEAFETLRKACLSPPVLAHPRWDREFTIMSDGSPTGVGACLAQENDEGQLVAVAYFSKALTPAQQAYGQCEIETLALLSALEVWKSYFMGNKVNVIVDAEALRYLLKPSTKYAGRMLRWLLRLSCFNIDVTVQPGKENVIADLLSRSPVRSKYGQDVFDSIENLYNQPPLQMDDEGRIGRGEQKMGEKCLHDPPSRKRSEEPEITAETTPLQVLTRSQRRREKDEEKRAPRAPEEDEEERLQELPKKMKRRGLQELPPNWIQPQTSTDSISTKSLCGNYSYNTKPRIKPAKISETGSKLQGGNANADDDSEMSM